MSAMPAPPIKGLDDLGPESRAIATPWSRIVRGIGLGQHPVGYDLLEAQRIRECVRRLEERVDGRDPYTTFASAVVDLVLSVTDPGTLLSPARLDVLVGRAAAAVGDLVAPYSRVTAGSILLDTVAKLGIDVSHVEGPGRDLPDQILASVDAIGPDAIQDENQGKHGDYERVAAWTAVFLSFGNLGVGDRLVSGARDRVAEALASVERIPTPFFRGRGASMLFTAVDHLGHGERLVGTADHLGSVLSYLDRVDELQIYPAFPSPMTAEFVKVYPLLTMLNTLGVTGRVEYLHRGRDRLDEAATLMSRLEPVERTHMGLYYVMALHNLGRLDVRIPDVDELVESLVGEWRNIDPGRDYFLYGISYAYLTQLAYYTGRADLLPEEMIDRMVTAFPALEGSAQGRANRPYPFSYTLNVLSELGLAERLLVPHARYDDQAPFSWVVDHLSPGGEVESARLYMVNHALISWALRTRSRVMP